jgi:hypothetical protein
MPSLAEGLRPASRSVCRTLLAAINACKSDNFLLAAAGQPSQKQSLLAEAGRM